MEAARALCGEFCSRYDWDSKQLRFVEAAEQPEEDGDPGTLHSHARTPQPLRESSDGRMPHPESTRGLQRGGRQRGGLQGGGRRCAAEIQEESILEAASALRRVETLGLRLIRECQHCPTAVALGQCLLELHVDLRCQAPVPRANAGHSVHATTRALARLWPLLEAADSIASAVRAGLDLWEAGSLRNSASARAAAAWGGITSLPEEAPGTPVEEEEPLASGAAPSGASAGPMPASGLHLLIIGAVSWQLELSRSLAESVQRALLVMLVYTLCPLLSATWDWMTRGALPSHEEFFVVSGQQAAHARLPSAVESWSSSFCLRHMPRHSIRRDPSSSSAAGQTSPEPSPCPVTPPGQSLGSGRGFGARSGVPAPHSAGPSDWHESGGGPGSPGGGGAYELPRATPGAPAAACPEFLEPLSAPVLACGRALLLLRRLHGERLAAAATAEDVAAMHAAYRRHGLVGTPPAHPASPWADTAPRGSAPSERAAAGAGTGAGAEAEAGDAAEGEGGPGGYNGDESDLLLSFIRALTRFLDPARVAVGRAGSLEGAAPGPVQGPPERDRPLCAAPNPEVDTPRPRPHAADAPGPRTSRADAPGEGSSGTRASDESTHGPPEPGRSELGTASPGERVPGASGGASGALGGTGSEQAAGGDQAPGPVGVPEVAAEQLEQVTEVASAGSERSNPGGSQGQHSQDEAPHASKALTCPGAASEHPAESQQPLHEPEPKDVPSEEAQGPSRAAVPQEYPASSSWAGPALAEGCRDALLRASVEDSRDAWARAAVERAQSRAQSIGEFSHLRGVGDADMWGPPRATAAITAAFTVALERDNFGFAREGTSSPGCSTSGSRSGSSDRGSSSSSSSSSCSPQQGHRGSDLEGEWNPNGVCREWAKKRYTTALASLGGARGAVGAVEELERLKAGPLLRLPPLPIIFQHCLLPQITAKVAQTQKALVHALMHECHLTRVLRQFSLVFLFQDGAVGEGLCAKLWEGLLLRSTQDWDELHMQQLFEGCMSSSVEFRGDPQAVQLQLQMDPRALPIGQRNTGPAAGEHAGPPSAMKTGGWGGPPSATKTGGWVGPPSASKTGGWARHASALPSPGAGHRGSDDGEYSGTVATPGGAPQASVLGSGTGLPQGGPAPAPQGAHSFPPLLPAVPPPESPLSSPAPARWSTQSSRGRGERGPRTSRGGAHTTPEDLLLQLLGSIRLRHTLASTSWPLQLVLDPQALASYQQLFTFLSRLALAKSATEEAYSRTLQVQKRIPLRQRQASVALSAGMRNVHVLCASLHSHFVNKVVGFHWEQLLRKVEVAASLEDVQRVHHACLTSLTLHCFLGAAKGPLDTNAEVFVATAVEVGVRYSLLHRKALKAATAAAAATAKVAAAAAADARASATAPAAAPATAPETAPTTDPAETPTPISAASSAIQGPGLSHPGEVRSSDGSCTEEDGGSEGDPAGSGGEGQAGEKGKERESGQGLSRGSFAAVEAEMGRLRGKLLLSLEGFRKARAVRGEAAPAHIQELAASIDFGRGPRRARTAGSAVSS